MSDYTPTTEEVRKWVAFHAKLGMSKKFDLWLAEVKADAFAQGRDSQRDHAEHMERNRIVALLEDPANHRNDVEPDWYEGIADAIALIKGENSD